MQADWPISLAILYAQSRLIGIRAIQEDHRSGGKTYRLVHCRAIPYASACAWHAAACHLVEMPPVAQAFPRDLACPLADRTAAAVAVGPPVTSMKHRLVLPTVWELPEHSRCIFLAACPRPLPSCCLRSLCLSALPAVRHAAVMYCVVNLCKARRTSATALQVLTPL